MTPGALSLIVLWSALQGAAPNQAAAGPQIRPAFAGDCALVVALTGQRPGDVVQVQIGFGRLPAVTIAAEKQETVDVPTNAPLQVGESLILLINGAEIARTTAADSKLRPAGARPTGTCTAPADEAFDGSSFEATAYYGRAYDQFAPDSMGGYPPGTTTAKHNRQLFGVDFDYRMLGTDRSKMQLWFAGQTVHGVRSADIDCSAETNKPAICDPKDGTSYARAVLENASSLEAYVAPRIEFARLQRNSTTPSRLYLTARFGFIALVGAPRVFKNHHVGLGLQAEDGPFEGSVFEVGWGNNQMLSGTAWKRLKVDGLVTFSLQGIPWIRDKAHFFIEMFIDNDLRGHTPDSIQTFMGFDIDIRKFFGG
jgi:hypothetical protein